MKRLMILGAVWALAVAKPELYKEKEDFQFSRSSSDDGTKAGYYGAQRGNMGGNYERAHNMDSLAQNQMSGVVKQVEGELGDGANTRTGSVYSAANSRGTYGSGHFDLSNLAGRNFQEGTSYGDSHSQSLHSSSAYNAAYDNSRSQSSRHNGYQATGYSGFNQQTDDLQALTDHSQRTGQYDYDRQTSQAAGYNAQSGYQQHAAYDASNTNLHSGGYGSNVHTRIISATPVRVIVRPGTRVAIPIAAQTYDLTQGSTLIAQNTLNSDAEVLSNDNQRTVYRLPSNAKHYESSYNYRKEWEKHDTIPSNGAPSTSTDNPFPRNSELYEDGQALRAGSEQHDTRRVDSQRAHSAYGGYNAAVKSTSGQSRYNYDASQRNAASHTNANTYSVAGYGANHQETSSDSSLNGYNIQSQHNTGRYHGASADALTQASQHNTGFNAAADLNSQVENLNGKPKSYQSAYSYHKSWERQGDPYVIKPASSAYYDGQSSQRLTGSTQNLGYLASGSHYQHSHASGADCDENGHIRVARSYNTDQFQDMQQQSQNLEDLVQQQSQNLEDLSQQQSQILEDLGQQQSQNLEDFGQQQSQNLEYFGQQQQSQNLEDFGQQQQSQNLEDFGQQQQSQNLEDFGQQQQSQNLDYFGQEQQSQKLEDLGQQHQQNLEDLGQQVENLGQQTEVQFDSQQEAGQQTQNTWENLENLSQQTHKKWDEMQHTWDKFEDLGQKPQENQNDLRQRPQDTETELKNNTQDQQTQDKWGFNFKEQDEQQNATAQEHVPSNKLNQQETQPQQNENIFSNSQQSQHNNDQMSVWDKFDLGSDQYIQQHKYNSEHANSNGNQVNWSFVSQQVGLDQQPLNSGINPESQSVYHDVNNGSTEQITSTTQSHKTEQSNTGSFNLHDSHFNISTNQNQFWNAENSFQETHKLQQSNNWYFSNGRRQEQTTNTDSSSHVSAFDTTSPNTSPLANLWDKLGNFEQTLVSGNVDKGQGNAFSQVHTNTQNSNGNSMHAYHNIENTSQEPLNSQMKPYHHLMLAIVTTTEKGISQNKSNDTKTEKESSLDVGRGDIGPEDLSDLKPEKYPTDIPESSETVQNQDENNGSKNITNAHHNNQDVQHHNHTYGQHYFHQDHDFQEQKDAINMGQQNLHVFSLHDTIEQQNQDSDKQHNLEQQDYEQSLVQQNQQHVTQQENEEKVLSDFGNKDNLEQQNLQDFGQQANVEQQNLQDFGQQVNLEQIQDFGQQENLEQIQDFDKHDNLEQQNLQDFGQQANVEQQNLQDFGKQDNLEQQNLQDFGQQVNLEQIQDFDKHDNLQQQNLQDFGKQDNLEQQNLQDFGQQVNLEQIQGFDKHDNLQQQNLQVFGKQDNLEQQNLQNFGQQANLEQIQDFDKHDNLQQQNLQDFGPQENLEQQYSQDFEKQDNLQQQVSQDFGQQAYLEQHNLQSFGSQDDLQRQNKNLEQLSQNPEQSFKYPKEERTALPKNNAQSQTYLPPPEEIEEPVVKKQINDLHSFSTPSTETSPIEPVTESTGFWKSIGNKFSRAKSKISSWF